MLPFAWYILKVIICSGILYGYYLLLLRNKIFHGYNRFYLMAAVALSLLLPLLKINFWQQDSQQQTGVIKVLQVVSNGDEYMDTVIISSKTNELNIELLYPLAYLTVSLLFFIIFIQTLFIIRALLKKYPRQIIDTISFVNTDAKSTPFSFLNYIFWNNNIDIETATGKQIFKHEVAHVQEKHTYDKLFVNIALIFFWCNPIYWLIRKELNMIHEFIADKKALEDSDTSAFAAMILQATYPQHRFQLTNNFFYSPIKRRLAMLVKNNNPKVTYYSRVMVLPLAVVIFAAFTFKVKDKIEAGASMYNNTTADNRNKKTTEIKNFTDTVPIGMIVNAKYGDPIYFKSPEYKTKALIIVDDKEIGNFGISYVDKSNGNYSSMVIYNPKEAKKIYGEKGKYGVIALTQKSVVYIKADSVFYDDKKFKLKVTKTGTELKENFSNALIYVDGKIVTAKELNTIHPEKIQSIDVLKGEKLDNIVEAKGKKSVIYVSLKPADLPEVMVISKSPKPLYVVDGEIKDGNFDVNCINQNDIESINVLKGNTAVEKYGTKGKYGVAEIITKKNRQITTVTIKPADDGIVFTNTEVDAKFPGEDDAWRKYLEKNLNPEIPLTEGWKPGKYTLIVQFIVHTDGSLSDITGTNYQGSKTAQHCIDLIKNSPKWVPAVQNGRAVNAYRKQPVTFLVQEEKKKDITEIYSVPLKVYLLNNGKIDIYNMVGNGTFDTKSNKLFYVNGKITTHPESIKKEAVVFMETYDEGAGKKIFGEKGKHGVTIIKTKS